MPTIGNLGTLFVRDKTGVMKEVPVICGKDGLTPYIGENGNWWIGNVDTEISASGASLITISGHGAPGDGTDGAKNQLYYDEDGGGLYICVETENTLTWQKIASGGGSGTSDWDDISGKPFETIGEGLSVDGDGILSATSSGGVPVLETFDVTPEMLGYAVEDGTYTYTRDVGGDTYAIRATGGSAAHFGDLSPVYPCVMTMQERIGGELNTARVRCATVEFADGRQCDTAFHVDGDGTVSAIAARLKVPGRKKWMSTDYTADGAFEAGARYKVQAYVYGVYEAQVMAMYSEKLGKVGIFSDYKSEDPEANGWYIVDADNKVLPSQMHTSVSREVLDEGYIAAATAQNVRVVEVLQNDDGSYWARSRSGAAYEEVTTYTLFSWIAAGDCAIVLVEGQPVDSVAMTGRPVYTLAGVQRTADYTGQAVFLAPVNPQPGALRGAYVFSATRNDSGTLTYAITYTDVPQLLSGTAYVDAILLSSGMDDSAPVIFNDGNTLKMINPGSPLGLTNESMPVLWDEWNQMADAIGKAFVMVPDTGAVGQVLVVDAVDENGKPTAWHTVDLPEGGGGESYELPIATADTLGGVKPVAKTEAMEQEVGVDIDGRLYTVPGTVTAEQVSDSVNAWLDEHPEATTTVADGSITSEKLAENAVTADKLSAYAINCREVKWELFMDGYNTNGGVLYEDPKCAIYALKLEAGKKYIWQSMAYPLNTNETVAAPTYADNKNPGWYFAYTEMPNGTISGSYSKGIINTVISTSQKNGYIQIPEHGYICAFSALRDIYLLRASRKPDNGKSIDNNMFFDVGDEFPDFKSDISNIMQVATIFQKDLGNGTSFDRQYIMSALSSSYAQQNANRQYLAMSRDVPRDRGLYIQFIGDSITYARSNAGEQNCFRKYVSMNLNAPCNTYCQSGISVTTGGGSYDWNGKLTGNDGYDAEMTGYRGLQSKISTEQSSEKIMWREYVDIVVIALGTNDHWNSSPLGTVDDLEDDTTFYGAVEKTITLVEAAYPNAHILWMLPFKNQKWNETNDAGCTMLDYLIALKIICQMHDRVFVLDLFDKWFLNYDNEAQRKKFFIDSVHITGNAHKCVAESMIEKIREIIAIRGLRRIQTVNRTNGNDSVYGTLCTGISLSDTELVFTEAGTQTLVATVVPEDTTQIVSWKSANTAVAKVQNGTVMAVGDGETVITATCGAYSATCTVAVSGIS